MMDPPTDNMVHRLNSVTTKYSRKLRQLAAMDNLLKTAGPTTYAQAVLVPELAVLLIKEDMNVDSQDARQILRDSTDIGNRLNAAENDQIHTVEDDSDNDFP
jgi:RTC4-like domain